MPRFPKSEQAFITYAKDRSNQWNGGQSGPPVIGLTAAQRAETAQAVTEAQAAYSAMLVARGAARDATQLKNVKLEALRAIFGADVDTIDAYAKATGDSTIYSLAGIPAPKDPSGRDAPPAPVFGQVVQAGSGFIRGTFTVVSGGGAQYQLERRDTTLGNFTGPWNVVGVLTEKSFEDQGVPVGLLKVEYRVRAQLSTGAVSPWSNAMGFNFGTQGSPASPITAGSIVPVKAEDMKSAG
ncbi:MAG: hypothetical protein KIT54_04365 [Phycisphaeraceae bacterium]|nr:hypothetical protein [Phycisphaeraceae bacterium]